MILADTVGRSAGGARGCCALAERLNAPVVDLGARFNFPSDHPLEATERRDELLREADVIFAVDVVDLWGALQANVARHRPAGSRQPRTYASFRCPSAICWCTAGPPTSSACSRSTCDLVGESRVALPALADLVARSASDDAAEDRRARAERIGAEGRQRRAGLARAARARSLDDGAVPLGASGTWRCATRWRVVTACCPTATCAVGRGACGASISRTSTPARRAAPASGYGIGASLGVGLAHKGSGRIVLNLQPDGDLLYSSSALYTAAHEQLPLLTVMLNNHSYYNSEEHGLRMAEQRGRPAERAGIGTRPEGPNVDFAGLARSFGIAAAGPVTSVADLPRALATAVEAVAAGEPYLLDVVTEVR